MRKSFTLIELLVVVAIIAVLVAMLLPALQNAREQGKSVVCKATIRSLGNAHIQYAMEHGEFLLQYRVTSESYQWNRVHRTFWFMVLADQKYTPQDNAEAYYRCVSDPGYRFGEWWLSYGYNYYWLGGGNVRVTDVPVPDRALMFSDAGGVYRYIVAPFMTHPEYWPSDRHMGGSNIAFVDGHVEWRSLVDMLTNRSIWYIE